jgi:hypothetical protein
MATIESLTSKVSVEIEPTAFAMRATNRPTEYGGLSGGHFAAANSTNGFAFVTGAVIFAFRHVTPGTVSIIQRIYGLFTAVTAITAQFSNPMQLVRLVSFTSDYTTNVNTTLGGSTGYSPSSKRSTGMLQVPTSHFASTSAAAGMTGGVSTVANTLGVLPVSGLTGLGTFIAGDLYNQNSSGPNTHPLVLAQNEGFYIINGTTIASGLVLALCLVEWAEVPAY